MENQLWTCGANDVTYQDFEVFVIIFFILLLHNRISSHAIASFSYRFREKTFNLHFNFTWHR